MNPFSRPDKKQLAVLAGAVAVCKSADKPGRHERDERVELLDLNSNWKFTRGLLRIFTKDRGICNLGVPPNSPLNPKP